MGSVRQLTVATGLVLALTTGMLTMFMFSTQSSGLQEMGTQVSGSTAPAQKVRTTTVTITQTVQPPEPTLSNPTNPSPSPKNETKYPNPHIRPCRRCKYQIDYEPMLNESLYLYTTNGWGRTGNVMMALRMAMNRAHACKTLLQLPPKDDSPAHVLSVHPERRFFDFRKRPGPPAHPDCKSPDVAIGMASYPSKIWTLPDLPNITSEHNAFHTAYVQEWEEISACLRWYAGLCDDDVCSRVGDMSNTLVMHFRMGDVFHHEFQFTSELYGQPPTSYYLAALAHRPWDRVFIMGGEDFYNYNPSWIAIYRMFQHQSTRMPLILQNNDWETDFAYLLCARYVVESHTTFSAIWDVGFAEEIYTWRPCETLAANVSAGQLSRKYHHISQTSPYNWYYDHQNSRDEYLDMLMVGSNVPIKCPIRQEHCCTGDLMKVRI